MKIAYTLTDEDVRKIIADKFNTSADNVGLILTTESRGYGLNESSVTVVSYQVTIDSDLLGGSHEERKPSYIG